MSNFNTEFFTVALGLSRSAEDVDEAFSRLCKTVPADERQAVGKEIERIFLAAGFDKFKDTIRTYGAAAVKVICKEMGDSADGNSADSVRMGQKQTQIFINLKKINGDAASPLVSAYVDAVENNLTIAEYNSAAVYTKPMCALVDAFAESEDLYRPLPSSRNSAAPRA